jgi:hypothetical protein
MIARLGVGVVHIALEETRLTTIQIQLGGVIGHRGDASEALEWLCYQGTGSGGRWALWLENSELGGGRVDGFTLEHLDQEAALHCQTLRGSGNQVALPIALAPGMAEDQIPAVLGRPTAKFRTPGFFVQEHKETIKSRPFTSSNTVAISARGGVVWAIQVWKNTES